MTAFEDRREQALDVARRAGAELLLASDPGTVWWLTGLAAPLETGPSPFVLPPLVLLAPGEPARLIVGSDDEPADLPGGVVAEVYEGFATGPLEGPERGAATVERLVGARRLAAEAATLPRLAAPGDVVDVGAELRLARAVKDAGELSAIRRSVRSCDAGQRRLRSVVAAGASELEVFAAVRAAMEVEAGERLPLLADLVSGPRAAEMGGPPTARTLAPGDAIMCDLAPRVGGVWGDSCATVAVGRPSPELRGAHTRVRAALERAIEAVRPGMTAGELDAAVRCGLDYPHHTGHGIGGSYHEEPRIVPGAPTVLRPGMVIALEPALYGDGFGVRLEHVVVVTDDGCVDLSGHTLELDDEEAP